MCETCPDAMVQASHGGGACNRHTRAARGLRNGAQATCNDGAIPVAIGRATRCAPVATPAPGLVLAQARVAHDRGVGSTVQRLRRMGADRLFGAAREAPAGGVALHTRVLATEEVKYAATSAASCSGVQGEGMLMGNKQCAKCAGNILTWQVPGAARRHICAGRTRRRVYWFGCSEA